MANHPSMKLHSHSDGFAIAVLGEMQLFPGLIGPSAKSYARLLKIKCLKNIYLRQNDRIPGII
ncbi:MAG: hypothetical protein WAV89_16230 [Ignavibacteriaceae bacterium]